MFCLVDIGGGRTISGHKSHTHDFGPSQLMKLDRLTPLGASFSETHDHKVDSCGSPKSLLK